MHNFFSYFATPLKSVPQPVNQCCIFCSSLAGWPSSLWTTLPRCSSYAMYYCYGLWSKSGRYLQLLGFFLQKWTRKKSDGLWRTRLCSGGVLGVVKRKGFFHSKRIWCKFRPDLKIASGWDTYLEREKRNGTLLVFVFIFRTSCSRTLRLTLLVVQVTSDQCWYHPLNLQPFLASLDIMPGGDKEEP